MPMQINQEKLTFGKEPKQKDNGSSTKNFDVWTPFPCDQYEWLHSVCSELVVLPLLVPRAQYERFILRCPEPLRLP